MTVARATCPVSGQHRPFQHEGSYELFREARSSSPVFYNEEIGYWVITRNKDIRDILKDPATFSADIALQPVCPYPDELKAYLAGQGFTPQKVHPDCDPPLHARYREVAAQYLNIRHYKAIEDEMRALVLGYVDRMKGQSSLDLVEALTYEFPARVIFLLLGASEVDPLQIKSWANNRLDLIWGNPAREAQLESGAPLVDFWRFTGDLIRQRQENPGDDYPSFLLAHRKGDDAILTLNEIQSMVFALLFAGHETTTNAAGNLLIELLQRPGLWQRLVAEPELIPAAVEEGLRKVTSVIAWRRRTTSAVTIGGVEIPQDAKLLICLGSANRDEAVFDAPDAFNLDRPNARQHISFGQGEHFCVGGPLARIELKLIVEELTRAFPEMRLTAGQRFEWYDTLSFRGPKRILVELTP